MSQADGRNSLKRISLNLKTDSSSKWYNFKINPESYQESHPQRSTVFRTREAVVVEDFGPDLGVIQFSGTTGFRYMLEDPEDSRSAMNGAGRLFKLQKLLEEYSLTGFTTEPGGNPNNAELIFYNRTDGKAWYVHLGEDGFSIERSVEESLLYRYSVDLVILRKISEPSEREIDYADIGNPINVSGYTTSTRYINKAMNPYTSESNYRDPADKVSNIVGTSDDKGNTMLAD